MKELINVIEMNNIKEFMSEITNAYNSALEEYKKTDGNLAKEFFTKNLYVAIDKKGNKTNIDIVIAFTNSKPNQKADKTSIFIDILDDNLTKITDTYYILRQSINSKLNNKVKLYNSICDCGLYHLFADTDL